MTQILKPSVKSVQLVAAALKKNQVAALPTETVYGLAGNGLSKVAINKIFEAKGRPKTDPLILHLPIRYKKQKSILLALCKAGLVNKKVLKWESRSSVEKLLKKYWPGPLTVVLPKGAKVPLLATSGHPSVALRMPAHPWFQKVLAKVSFPLAAPSANRFGKISPTEAFHVMAELKDRIPLILDGGPCKIGVESTIIKLEEDHAELLRPGKISAKDVTQYLPVQVKSKPTYAEESTSVVAPGLLDNHYAPTKRMWFALNEAPPEVEVKSLGQNVGVLNLSKEPLNPSHVINQAKNIRLTLHLQNSLEQIAKELFRSLRALDEEPSIDAILVISPKPSAEELEKNKGLYDAILDRLSRASVNKPLR